MLGGALGVEKTGSSGTEAGRFGVCLTKGRSSGRVAGTGHSCWRQGWRRRGLWVRSWGFLKCELKGLFRAVLLTGQGSNLPSRGHLVMSGDLCDGDNRGRRVELVASRR